LRHSSYQGHVANADTSATNAGEVDDDDSELEASEEESDSALDSSGGASVEASGEGKNSDEEASDAEQAELGKLLRDIRSQKQGIAISNGSQPRRSPEVGKATTRTRSTARLDAPHQEDSSVSQSDRQEEEERSSGEAGLDSDSDGDQVSEEEKDSAPALAGTDSDEESLEDEEGNSEDIGDGTEGQVQKSHADASGAAPGEGKFFAHAPKGTKFKAAAFTDLGLSRPLLKAISALGYTAPTPIQAAVVPLALAGRDLVASAITGSGKTAAFALPMLERLLFRQRSVAATHILVLCPTRELAAQVRFQADHGERRHPGAS
jgi:DEAD/DEAH box helicase